MHTRVIRLLVAAFAVAVTGCATTEATTGSGHTAASQTGPALVGFDYVSNQSQAAAAQGVQGSASGNLKLIAEALAKDVNAHGGVGGRPVRLVLAASLVPQNPSAVIADEQAACQTFTVDHHVSVAISAATEPRNSSYFTCLGRQRIPAIGDFGVTGQTLQQFPLLFLPDGISLTRLAAGEVASLTRRGFLARQSRIGVIGADVAPYKTAATVDIPRALAAAGLKAAATGTVDTSTVQTALVQMQALILKFKSEGIDRVLVAADSGTAAGTFLYDAAKQHYSARLALTSNDFPYQILENVPPAAFTGAVGLGWTPLSGDVSPGRSVPQPPAAAACERVMAQAGLKTSDVNVLSFQLQLCDDFFFLKAVGDATHGRLDAKSFASGVRALGSSFQSAATFATDFGSRNDGAAAARDFSYQSACRCLRYDATSNQPLP